MRLPMPVRVDSACFRMCYLTFMRRRDTSEEAARIQDELHERLGPEGRFELAMRMSELAHEFARSGFRNQRPDLTDDDFRREFVRVLYDK